MQTSSLILGACSKEDAMCNWTPHSVLFKAPALGLENCTKIAKYHLGSLDISVRPSPVESRRSINKPDELPFHFQTIDLVSTLTTVLGITTASVSTVS